MLFDDEQAQPVRITTTKDLGKLIRERRKALNVTQVTASGLAGVGVRFLSELERGKETVELGKALRVLQRLGLEIRLVPRQHPVVGPR